MSKESPHLKNQKAGDAGSPAQQNGQPETPPSQSLIVPILTTPRLLGNVVCLLRAARKGRGKDTVLPPLAIPGQSQVPHFRKRNTSP